MMKFLNNLILPTYRAEASLERADGAFSVSVEHRLENAPYIEKAIKEEKANYACLVSDPMMGYRKVHVSAEPRQSFVCPEEVTSEAPDVQPMIVATERFTHQFTDADKIGEIFHGAQEFAKGSRLATVDGQSGTSRFPGQLLAVTRDDSVSGGGFAIEPDPSGEFCFKIKAASEMYDFLQVLKSQNWAHPNSIIAHIMHACFGVLTRDYPAAPAADGEGRAGHPDDLPRNLIALKEFMEEMGVGSWQSIDFDPLDAATRLCPYKPEHLTPGAPVKYDSEQDKLRYGALCNRLAPNDKGREMAGEEHLELLSMLLDRNSFIRWYEKEMGTGQIDWIEALGERIEGGQFAKMAPELEMAVFDSWKNSITPAMACEGSFWSRVAYMQIKAGKIDADQLAIGGRFRDGKERIHHLLSAKNPGDIDDAVRDALRSLGGLHNIRGRRTVYVDCSLAKAWWKACYANEISGRIGVDAGKILEMFRSGKGEGIWTSFIEPFVRERSVINYPEVRDGLMWALVDLQRDEVSPDLIKSYHQTLKDISATRELGIYKAEEIKNLLKNKSPYAITVSL